MPDNFLSEYEITRVDLDNYGALPQKVQPGQEHMLLGFYLISKVLIGLVLLQKDIFGDLTNMKKLSKMK